MANTVNRKMGILPIFLNDVIFIALPIKLRYYNKHTGVKTVVWFNTNKPFVILSFCECN